MDWNLSKIWLEDDNLRRFVAGVLGGLVALVGKAIIEKWRSPKLEIDKSVFIKSKEDNWGRIRVTNIGKSAAINARVIAIPIYERITPEVEEIFDFYWSDIAKHEVTIPSKTARYFDIVNESTASLDLLATNNIQTLHCYKFRVFATAENTKTVHSDIEIIPRSMLGPPKIVVI